MTIEDIITQLESFRQNAREYIYSVCCSKGTEVPPAEEENGYFKLSTDINLEFNHIDLHVKIIEIRAYIGEGWIYVVFEDIDDPVDFDDLYSDDIHSILTYLKDKE